MLYMSHKYDKGIFLFHRDLRIEDNIGLNHASKQCNKVYCCFIFTPEQVGNQNKYKSDNSVQFMLESLDALDKSVTSLGGELIFLHGNNLAMLETLFKTLSINAFFHNKDVTPYSIARDNDIKMLCDQMNIYYSAHDDSYLIPPGTIVTGTNKPYQKYTPFYDKVKNTVIQPVSKYHVGNLAKTSMKIPHRIQLVDAIDLFLSHPNSTMEVRGGRINNYAGCGGGLKRLHDAVLQQGDYEKKRDELSYQTSKLSAYIKFGCVSIREVYHAFVAKYGKHSGFIRELWWHDFFAHVLFGFPEVIGKSFVPQYRDLSWSTNESHLQKWKDGCTGFPVIDAGMRQLNETGYMHNRVRMAVASFLAKTLLIDWRKGEQYFATKLVDYDVASNNGNWQSICSTGVDRKPYFRDMNPWIQSSKFDPQCEYIKRWIPELESVPAHVIHKWYEKHAEHRNMTKYPAPIVNYAEQKEKMMKMYNK